VEVVIIQRERMAEISDRPFHDFDARVDLLAAVSAWISDRKPPCRSDSRFARRDDGVGDVDVVVLNDRTALRRSPDDVEGAHRLTRKIAFAPRAPERLSHDAIERAVSTD